MTGGGASTILYAAIPWTAGGDGDYHLTSRDETGGFACQDGGFEPNEKELEAKEREPTETAKARFEFEEKAKLLKEPAEEEKEQETIEPVDQEPNQLGSTRSSDGSYDLGLADLTINQIAVEQQDIVTDPLFNAWQDPTGNEVTDECRNTSCPERRSAGAERRRSPVRCSNQRAEGRELLPQRRIQPGRIANTAPRRGISRCLTGGGPVPSVRLEPKFTSPNTVKAQRSRRLRRDGVRHLIEPAIGLLGDR